MLGVYKAGMAICSSASGAKTLKLYSLLLIDAGKPSASRRRGSECERTNSVANVVPLSRRADNSISLCLPGHA